MSRTSVIAGVLGLVALQALVLYMLGQPFLAANGEVWLWVNEPLSPNTSQHLMDWYTPSHIIHGFLFYWILGYFFPKLSRSARLIAAVGLEVAWEVVENTPMVIEHYRSQALAQGYVGDSILNSLCDTVAMIAGFFAAWRLPVWGSVVLVLALELVVLYFIRDGLALNVLGMFYQFEVINNWQLSR